MVTCTRFLVFDEPHAVRSSRTRRTDDCSRRGVGARGCWSNQDDIEQLVIDQRFGESVRVLRVVMQETWDEQGTKMRGFVERRTLNCDRRSSEHSTFEEGIRADGDVIFCR